jgi:hypothetical protein
MGAGARREGVALRLKINPGHVPRRGPVTDKEQDATA